MSANPNLVRPDRETMLVMVETMTDMDIARKYGCTGSTVAKWRDRYGIPRSPKQWGGNTIKWKTNRAYFSQIDTPEKAYILGLIIADGHVRKDGSKVEISLKESDAALLEAVAREVGCDAPLLPMTNHYDGSLSMRLYLCGKQIVTDLNALGVQHDKSTSAAYPAVATELERHLVRGIFDGDGHFQKRCFELIGAPALLDGVCAAIERHTGCVLRRRLSGRDKRYHYAFGSGRDTPVVRWMYSGATIALPRKLEAARAFCYGVLDPAYIVSGPSS
jgi:hypothetical protein